MKQKTDVKYRERRCRNSFVAKKLKEAFGWRLVNVAEKKTSWVANDGSTRELTKKYCIMRRVSPYSRNLIFRLTELLANIFDFLRALLWILLIPVGVLFVLLVAEFTGDIFATFMPFDGMQLLTATLVAFAVVYAGCFLCILLGGAERALFGINRRYGGKNYEVQSGVKGVKFDLRIVESKWHFWKAGAKRAKVFGWKLYKDLRVDTEALFTNYAENQHRIARNNARVEEFMDTCEAVDYDDSIVDYAREKLERELEELDETVERGVTSSYYTALIRPAKYNFFVRVLEKLDGLFLLLRNLALIAVFFTLAMRILLAMSNEMFVFVCPILLGAFVLMILLRGACAGLSFLLRIKKRGEEKAWCEVLGLPEIDK